MLSADTGEALASRAWRELHGGWNAAIVVGWLCRRCFLPQQRREARRFGEWQCSARRA